MPIEKQAKSTIAELESRIRELSREGQLTICRVIKLSGGQDALAKEEISRLASEVRLNRISQDELMDAVRDTFVASELRKVKGAA